MQFNNDGRKSLEGLKEFNYFISLKDIKYDTFNLIHEFSYNSRVLNAHRYQ